MGSEQLTRSDPARAEQSERERERLVSAVAASSTDHLGRFVVRLDNGQVWRQMDAGGLPVRLRGDDRQAVEITRSGFGGYRMKFPELGRTVAVARVE